MYDSIRSGSISPLFSSTIGYLAGEERAVRDRPAAPSAVPPFRPATIDAACVGADLLVERALGIDLDQRPLAAEPHAADARRPATCSPRPALRRRPPPAASARRARSTTGSRPPCSTRIRIGLLRRQLLLGDLLEVNEVHGPAILSSAPTAAAGSTLPQTSPSKTTTGARPQAPRQRAVIERDELAVGRRLAGSTGPHSLDGGQQRRRPP